MKLYYLRILTGVISFGSFVWCLHTRLFSISLITFSLAFVLLVGAFHTKLCSHLKQRLEKALPSHFEEFYKTLKVQNFICVWLLPILCLLGMAVSLYFKKGIIMVIFCGLFVVLSGIAYMKDVQIYYDCLLDRAEKKKIDTLNKAIIEDKQKQ